ncbi:unnamed protein product, partial [Lampetra planeri]
SATATTATTATTITATATTTTATTKLPSLPPIISSSPLTGRPPLQPSVDHLPQSFAASTRAQGGGTGYPACTSASPQSGFPACIAAVQSVLPACTGVRPAFPACTLVPVNLPECTTTVQPSLSASAGPGTPVRGGDRRQQASSSPGPLPRQRAESWTVRGAGGPRGAAELVRLKNVYRDTRPW